MFKCLNQFCTEIMKGHDTQTDTAFYSLGYIESVHAEPGLLHSVEVIGKTAQTP